LQSLTKGFKSVEDYYKKIEVIMIWVNVMKDIKATIVRFMNELNHDIENVVELQNYMELENIMHMAMKVEQ
jgi:hypothetical protein